MTILFKSRCMTKRSIIYNKFWSIKLLFLNIIEALSAISKLIIAPNSSRKNLNKIKSCWCISVENFYNFAELASPIHCKLFIYVNRKKKTSKYKLWNIKSSCLWCDFGWLLHFFLSAFFTPWFIFTKKLCYLSNKIKQVILF